ncbi:MAG TPA: hypothetical protein DCE41_27915, partial [Cytophagales bacterium]|nr:hypothetical protein [Cytophagales bacterium]
MEPTFDLFTTEEERTRARELLFGLHQRKTPIVVWMSGDTPQRMLQLRVWLQQFTPEYRHHVLDLADHPVETLYGTLQKALPPTVLQSDPVQWTVHLVHLERHLLTLTEGRVVDSGLTKQLNFERENLFRFPFNLVIWSSPAFFERLKQEALDLSSWVSQRYHFSDPGPASLTPAPLPERLAQRGTVPQRTEGIGELQTQLSALPLETVDEKAALERLSLLELLGYETAEARRWERSKALWREAMALRERWDRTNGEGLFYLGQIALGQREFAEALALYQQALAYSKEHPNRKNEAVALHQLGRVAQEQRDWQQAQEYFQKALDIYIEFNDRYSQASTYHQLGIVAQE